jgi:hypothetical protein
MRRITLGAIAAFTLVVLSVSSALAGGWAVSTLDPLPAVLEPGQTYRVGYTIRQHGVEPVDLARFRGSTEIVAWTPDMSQHLRFPGRPDGAPGHYVAEVRLPTAGKWSWEVTQNPFASQPLGEIAVQAPAPAPASVAAAPAPAKASSPLPAFVTPLLVGSAVALLGALLFVSRRESRLAGQAGR